MLELTRIATTTGATGGFSLVATSGEAQSSDAVWYAWSRDFEGQPSGSYLRRGLGHPAGGVAAKAPAVALNADGRLEVVVVGLDQAVWHRWQTAPQIGTAGDATGGVWSEWESLGRPDGQAIMTLAGLTPNQDGRLELFTVAGDGAVWHRWQHNPGGSWAAWSSLGTPRGLPSPGNAAVTQNHDGRLELFTVAGDGSVWHRWQTAPGRRTWAAWSSLGSPGDHAAGGLALARNKDGRLELFSVASDGAVWHRWQRAPGVRWSEWDSLASEAGGFNEVGVGAHADGRLLIVAIGASPEEHTIWHREQAVTGGWSRWESRPGSVSSFFGPLESPTLTRNFDGELIVQILTPPPTLIWEFSQDDPNGPFTTGFGWGPLNPVGDVPADT